MALGDHHMEDLFLDLVVRSMVAFPSHVEAVRHDVVLVEPVHGLVVHLVGAPRNNHEAVVTNFLSTPELLE